MEGTVLIRDHVVFIFRVERLVVWWHVHVVVGQLIPAEVFEEICDAAGGQVDVRAR
jgi:hypothetical protein